MARVAVDNVPRVSPAGPPAGYENIQTSPAAYGAGIGEATQKLGAQMKESAGQVFDVALKYQQMNNETEALNSSAEASRKLGDMQNEFRQLKGLDAGKALPAYQQKIIDMQNEMAGQLKSPVARLSFLRDFRSYADRAQINMGLHAGDQMDTANMAALKGSIEAAKSRAVQNAATSDIAPDFHDIVSRTAQLGIKMGLPKEAVDAQIQQHVGDVMRDVVTARIASGDTASAKRIFEQARDETAPGTDLPLLDGNHIAQISQTIQNREYTDAIRAEREQARQDRLADEAAARTRVYISHTFDNATSMVMAGHPAQNLPNNAEIDAAYPKNPDLADEMKQRVDDVRQISTFLGVLPGATPEQIDKLRAQVQPDPNDQTNFARRERMAKALDSALDIRAKAIRADPAGYVSNTDAQIGQQLQAAVKDPTQFPAYAQSVLSQQDQMGVPAAAQAILPAQVAVAFAGQVTSNPEQAPQRLKQMEQQFGSAWPHVFRDMVTLGKMPMEYQAVAALSDEKDGALLARALSDNAKNQKPWGDILGTKVESDIKTYVRSDTSVTSLLNSFSKYGDAKTMSDNVLKSIDTLAFAKAFYDRDPNAAADAVQSFTSKYRFLPNGGARVPAENFDSVMANANDALGKLSADKVAIPAIYGQEGMPKAEDYIDMLKASPNWITSPSADSIMLLDTQARLVRDKAGKPITIPFNAPPPIGAGSVGQEFVPSPLMQ